MMRPHDSPREDAISKIGRNDPCHCGSGNKYKKCHLAADEAAKAAELAQKQAAAAEAARLAAEADPEAAEEKAEAQKAAFTKAAHERAGKPPPAPTARQARRRGVS